MEMSGDHCEGRCVGSSASFWIGWGCVIPWLAFSVLSDRMSRFVSYRTHVLARPQGVPYYAFLNIGFLACLLCASLGMSLVWRPSAGLSLARAAAASGFYFLALVVCWMAQCSFWSYYSLGTAAALGLAAAATEATALGLAASHAAAAALQAPLLAYLAFQCATYFRFRGANPGKHHVIDVDTSNRFMDFDYQYARPATANEFLLEGQNCQQGKHTQDPLSFVMPKAPYFGHAGTNAAVARSPSYRQVAGQTIAKPMATVQDGLEVD